MAEPVDKAIFSASKTGRADDLHNLTHNPHNANAILEDHLGNTPLHYAAGGNHPSAVQVLLKAPLGVKVNHKNHMGDTPLHKVPVLLFITAQQFQAAARGGPEVVKILLAAGADPLIKNQDGKRAVDLAKDDELGELLTPQDGERKRAVSFH